jgi:hypothetical protein
MLKLVISLAKSLALIVIVGRKSANGRPSGTASTFFMSWVGLRSEPQISDEHVKNNHDVRDLLMQRGIQPEALPPAEDIKKVERRLASETKKIAANK